jgi:hypothetical protein
MEDIERLFRATQLPECGTHGCLMPWRRDCSGWVVVVAVDDLMEDI